MRNVRKKLKAYVLAAKMFTKIEFTLLTILLGAYAYIFISLTIAAFSR